MKIFCDGSYSLKTGAAAIGLVMINKNYIIGREGHTVVVKTSSESEYQALLSAMLWAIKTNARYVYTDAKSLADSWKDTTGLKELAGVFTGSVRWIPRERNGYADGIAKMTAAGIDWQGIIDRASCIKVKYSQTPMVWKAGNNIVTIHNHRFYCDCKKYKYLKGNHFHCSHIRAVMMKLRMINEVGEGIF